MCALKIHSAHALLLSTLQLQLSELLAQLYIHTKKRKQKLHEAVKAVMINNG